VSETAQELWTIEPRATGAAARAQEVWRYRRMFVFFGHRALLKLYRNTILGKSWIVLRPLVPLVMRVFLFGQVLSVSGPSHLPYFLFVAVGQAPWELFAASVMWATRSLELNGSMLTRLYVPRLILPVATMVPAFVNFGITLAIIAVTLVYYRVSHGVWYLDTTWWFVAPVAALLCVGLAFAIGLFTSVLATAARDVRFGLGYILEFWVYLTPVVYPLSNLPAATQSIVTLNPMTVFVVAFRGALLGGEGPTPRAWGVALAVLAVVTIAGLIFFQRAEAESVDNL
jgi:lipopolysaccharide transport system permease protein